MSDPTQKPLPKRLPHALTSSGALSAYISRPCTPDLFVFSEPARSIKLIFPRYCVLFFRFTFTVFTYHF